MSSLALPKEAQRNDIPIDEKNILLFLKLQNNKHRIVISSQAWHIVQALISLTDEDASILTYIIKSKRTDFVSRREHVTKSSHQVMFWTFEVSLVPSHKFTRTHVP